MICCTIHYTYVMGNASPVNKVGLVQDFTREEFDLYEPNCRPAGSSLGAIDRKYCYLGLSFGSETGFIDWNDSLKEVVNRDVATITQLLGKADKATHEFLGYGLTWLISTDEQRQAQREKYPDGKAIEWQSRIGVDPSTLAVKIDRFMGDQGCPFWKDNVPFTDDKGEAKLGHSMHSCRGGVDYTVTKTTTDGHPVTLTFGAILPSLIYHHGFYEGSVPHRVDPAKLIEFLEVK